MSERGAEGGSEDVSHSSKSDDSDDPSFSPVDADRKFNVESGASTSTDVGDVLNKYETSQAGCDTAQQNPDVELVEAAGNELEAGLEQIFIVDGGGDARLRPILRRKGNTCLRKIVKFSEETQYITEGEFEELSLPLEWTGVLYYTTDEIIKNYKETCIRTMTVPIDAIVKQLANIKSNTGFKTTLDLRKIKLNLEVVNTLETIFRMVTFHTVYVDASQLGLYAGAEFFDLIGYYDSLLELVLLGEPKIQEFDRIWHGVRLLALNSEHLCSIIFRETKLTNEENESNLIKILDAVNANEHIQRIRIEGCLLTRSLVSQIACALGRNSYIQELHLCYANMYFKEAELLAKVFLMNSTIKILNLNHNKIADRGFDELVKSLCVQARRGKGLVVLMVAHNRITKESAEALKLCIKFCTLLYSINLGGNNLTDSVIHQIKPLLSCSNSLTALGLQSVSLTNSGLRELVDIIQVNRSLRYLNLRANKAILPTALDELASVLHRTTITQIDLDESSRYCVSGFENPMEYIEVVNKIQQIVAVNKSIWDTKQLNDVDIWARKYSLVCESQYIPKNMPSYATHAPTSRFNVVPVPEASAGKSLKRSQRFTIISLPAEDSDSTVEQGTESEKSADKPPAEQAAVETEVAQEQIESITSIPSNPDIVIPAEELPESGNNNLGNTNSTDRPNDCVDGGSAQSVE